MIRLAEVLETFLPDLRAQYADHLLPGHHAALEAVLRCRTEAAGTVKVHCHDCQQEETFALSCGHRFCPQCQNEAVEQWLIRQRAKLLPVDDYLVTFTLPAQLRALAFAHQREVYDLLIKTAWQSLAQFGLNDPQLHGQLGATAVLHTHSRALDYHPHVHVVVPGGALETTHRLWRRKRGKFLFPEKALAKVFRAKWLAAMRAKGWQVTATLPKDWVADVKPVGNGDKALLYLGRYLYRGVMAEHNILSCQNGEVSFRYTDNQGVTQVRTLVGAQFLWLLLHHVLPKGFRRTRDYGLLHSNAKRWIQMLYLLLHLGVPEPKEQKPPLCCRHCGGTTVTLTICPRHAKPPDTAQPTRERLM